MSLDDVWDFLNDEGLVPNFGSPARDDLLRRLFKHASSCRERSLQGPVVDEDDLPF